MRPYLPKNLQTSIESAIAAAPTYLLTPTHIVQQEQTTKSAETNTKKSSWWPWGN